VPSYLYKYRAIDSDKDVRRFQEIIEDNFLYFGASQCMNDPFEGDSKAFVPKVFKKTRQLKKSISADALVELLNDMAKKKNKRVWDM
jgi:hypothetical protein